MRLRRLLLPCMLAMGLAAPSAFANHDRTLYVNGKIFTSNEQQLWAEGLAVEDNLIITVGTTRQVMALKDRNTKVVDLHGRILMPGFNDAHVHPFDTISFPRAARLNSSADFVPNAGPTLNEVLDLVKQGVAKNPPGTWLFVSVGSNVVEDPEATRFTLDTVAPDHPVLLGTWYGHGTFLNTRALRTIGIGETQPDPFGGFYNRVPGTQTVNGVAFEYAEHLIRQYFASQMSDAELQTLFEQFAASAAKSGYTSVQEFSIGVAYPRHLAVVAKSNIPIRWRSICFPLVIDEPCNVPAQFSPLKPFSKLTASGIKWVADGTDFERGALLTRDYADAPGVRGHLNFPVNALQAELKRSVNGPLVVGQPMFHTVGDGTADAVLDAMDKVGTDLQWKVRRPRIEHGTLLRPDRFPLARKMGVYVVQNPLHFALVPVSQARFVPSLLGVIDPMRSLKEAGIKVALGSDQVGGPGNPYLDLFFALTQPTHPSEAFTLEEALIAYTRTSAEVEFQEIWKGTLAPGKVADFVVLSRDIFDSVQRQHPEEIIDTHSVLTVVDGKPVFASGELN